MLVRLQRELHHELLARLLELVFRGLLVGKSKRFCLATASKPAALPRCSERCERLLFLCEVTCTSPGKEG